MSRIVSVFLCLTLLGAPVENQRVKYVALTFDDGPSGRFTRELLDGLAERDVKATFLLCGYRVCLYPRETERIAREGHEIGCHGYSHKNMKEMSRRDISAEIDDTNALLPQNARVRFLRPPGGMCCDAVRQVAEAKGLCVLSWTVDPKDWACHDAEEIQRRVLGSVKDGDVILLHDMSDSSVAAALGIIDALRDQGYRFVTASRLAALRGCTLRPGKEYAAFPPKPDPVQGGGAI